MIKRMPFMMLIFIMSMVATSVAGIVIYQLYSTQYHHQKDDLLKNVQGQVEMLEFIARNGDEKSKNLLQQFASDENILKQQENPGSAITLDSQWIQEFFGSTGRFLVGKKIGDHIYFFRLTERTDLRLPPPVLSREGSQGPMGRAMRGETGTMKFVGLGDANLIVAYAYIDSLQIGIFSRISISEIRAPFIKNGIITLVVSLLSIIIGTFFYRRYGVAYIEYILEDAQTQKKIAVSRREELHEVKSDHEKTEAKLEESENKYLSIFENSEDPMWLMVEGVFIHCNDAAVKVFRCKSKEIFSQMHPSQFSPVNQPDGNNSFLKAEEMMKLARDKGYARFYWTHSRIDSGEYFPAEVTLTRVMIDEKLGLHAMVRDITELKNMQDNLEDALADAKRANVAKSEFLASMSHEFRTPLNAILGFSEMIREEYLGPLGSKKYSEYAGDIHSSGTHLLELINDILDIAAIEARQSPIDKTYFDFAELVDECFSNVEPLSENNKIKLRRDLDEGLENVFAHKRGVKQIIINLLANGIKYNQEGGEVVLKAHIEDQMLCFCVEDNGFGIEEEFLSRILEPFSRAEDDVLMAQEGTGLGLSICQKLIEAYKGTINVSSTYGDGTAVNVIIPIDEIDQ
ncbi:MAG: PAS domain S-box protein [Emcibacteraceae bacterium]|nr:PAS domain S-box protein [Emcibacteraceae bacterium]